MTLPDELASSAPVFVAPMAGGPSTPELVIAAAKANHFSQLAGGYKSVDAIAEGMRVVREGGVDVFGMNLFVPNPTDVDRREYAAYAADLQPLAIQLGLVEPLPQPIDDDDDWQAKIDLLVSQPVAVTSFTFGLPDRDTVKRLRRAGTILMQTVTSAAEARAAEELGVDVLVVQGYAAGGHSGVLDPTAMPVDIALGELLRSICSVVGLPVIAAGGVAAARDVTEALEAGADAVAVGTAVLRSPESGASSLQKDALVDEAYDGTVLTRAFTGRAARALKNRFVLENDHRAPTGYPAVHFLTKPIRAAATANGDASAVNLWAGMGHLKATTAPAAEILAGLTP